MSVVILIEALGQGTTSDGKYVGKDEKPIHVGDKYFMFERGVLNRKYAKALHEKLVEMMEVLKIEGVHVVNISSRFFEVREKDRRKVLNGFKKSRVCHVVLDCCDYENVRDTGVVVLGDLQNLLSLPYSCKSPLPVMKMPLRFQSFKDTTHISLCNMRNKEDCIRAYKDVEDFADSIYFTLLTKLEDAQ
jgi:hypothetical protein